MGEATLELLEELPAYTDLLWEKVSGLVEVRGKVLEMGCGIGSITRRILRSPAVESLDAFDLNPGYIDRVRRELSDPRLRVSCARAEEVSFPEAAYDRAVSVNVLEHVEDDCAGLRVLARALRAGGECALLVPAHPSLYSTLDEGLSHHRRYTKGMVAALARNAGLEPRELEHWNPLGAVGWWLNGKVLRRKVLPAFQTAVYGRLGISLSRLLDRLNPFPVGLSLVARLVKATGPG